MTASIPVPSAAFSPCGSFGSVTANAPGYAGSSPFPVRKTPFPWRTCIRTRTGTVCGGTSCPASRPKTTTRISGASCSRGGGGPPLAVEGLPGEPREDVVGDPEDDHHHKPRQDDVRVRQSPSRPRMGSVKGVPRDRQGEEHPQESPQEEVRHSRLQEPDRRRVHGPPPLAGRGAVPCSLTPMYHSRPGGD